MKNTRYVRVKLDLLLLYAAEQETLPDDFIQAITSKGGASKMIVGALKALCGQLEHSVALVPQSRVDVRLFHPRQRVAKKPRPSKRPAIQ